MTGDGEFNPMPFEDDTYAFPTPIPSAGGSGGGRPRSPSPTPAPRPTPSLTATPAPDMYENDRGVTRNTPSMTIFPEGPDYAGTRGDDVFSGNHGANRPHEAMDYSDPVPNRPHTAMDFDPTPNRPHVAMDYDPNGLPVDPGMDAGPGLFGDNGAVNPFDQWWKQPFDTVTGSASAFAEASPNTGGSIWEGEDALGNLGNNLALGSDLSADLGSLGYGEDYPAALEAPESPFNALAEGSGIPVEPEPLNQDVGDTEWTANPHEPRRFLPGSEETVEPTPTRSLAGGGDIRTFNTPISLGAFLNEPLASLRYGEGYSVPFGGRPPDLQPGEGYIAPGAEQAGGHWVDVPGGQLWVEGPSGSQGAGGGQAPRNAQSSPSIRSELATTPPGMTVVGTDRQTGQPVYRETSTGKLFVNPGTGTPLTHYNYGTGQREALRETGSFSDSLNQGAEQQAMSPVKFGMNVGGDEGRSVNIPSQSGFIEILGEDGVFAERRPFNPRVDPATRGMLRNWSRTNTNALDVAARGLARSAGPAYGGTGG